MNKLQLSFGDSELRNSISRLSLNSKSQWKSILTQNKELAIQGKFFANKATGEMYNAQSGLMYDDYKELTDDVVKVREYEFVGNLYRRIVGAGLSRTVSIGKTLIDYKDMNSFNGAVISMDAANRESNQTNYDLKAVPLPIIHQDFVIPWRETGFSYKETDGVEESMFRVMETRDRMLLNGDTSIKVNGNELYGYTNHPGTIQKPAGISDWADPSNKNVVYDEAVGLVSDLYQNKTGSAENSLAMFVATDIKTALNYKNGAQNAGTNTTLLNEIENISEIASIEAQQDLPAGSVLIIELRRSTSDIAVASDVVPVPWTKRDQLEDIRFTIIASCTPRIKVDRNDRTGILYATK